MVRAPPCHGGGRGFESHPGRLCRIIWEWKKLFYNMLPYGILAQLGEHLPYKQRVTGSSPVGSIFVIYVDMVGIEHLAKFVVPSARVRLRS